MKFPRFNGVLIYFRIDENTVHGGSIFCNGGSGNNIVFEGNRKKIPDNSYAVDNCNIRIEEIQYSHNGTWRCHARSFTKTYSDTINITTIHSNDVTISTAALLGITIPIGVLLILLVVFLLIWCVCPVYLALCCCCIPACREKSENNHQKTHYTQTDRRQRSSSPSDATRPNIRPLPSHSARYVHIYIKHHLGKYIQF